MAISEVAACNLALARIGRAPVITSLRPPDASQEAQACGLFYDLEMTNICNEHDWSFLTVQNGSLVAVTNPSLLWAYAYALPSNFMQMIALYDANALTNSALYGDFTDLEGAFVGMESEANDPLWVFANEPQQQEYTVEADGNGNQVLFCNLSEPLLKYLSFPLIGQALPPLFVDAFVWKLAAGLAGTLIRDDVGVSAATRCLQAYESILGKATSADCKNINARIRHMPFGIRARFYG